MGMDDITNHHSDALSGTKTTVIKIPSDDVTSGRLGTASHPSDVFKTVTPSVLVTSIVKGAKKGATDTSAPTSTTNPTSPLTPLTKSESEKQGAQKVGADVDEPKNVSQIGGRKRGLQKVVQRGPWQPPFSLPN